MLEKILRKYEAIWLHCGDSLILVDVESERLLDANPQVEYLLKRSLNDIRRLHYTALHPTDQLHQTQRAFGNPEITIDLDILRPDGTQIPVQISTGTFLDDNGHLLAVENLHYHRAHLNSALIINSDL
ncbi:hypothetical protein CCP3SC1_1880001 [Gammaproteobacteria bacterium]